MLCTSGTLVVDTSLLVDAVNAAPADEDKRRRALDLLARRDGALSVQGLQELSVQSTRPSRAEALRHEEATAFVESLERFPAQAITLDVMRTALTFCEQFGLPYWDSADLAAARLSGCDVVYSEDLSPERDDAGLRAATPFTNSPESAG